MADLIASIKSRLRNLSRSLGKDHNFILLLYFQERFLYRLSRSKYRKQLILKGGLRIAINDLGKFRATKDLDLLGSNIAADQDNIENIIADIIKIRPDTDDGVKFIRGSISVETIKEGADYEGVRAKVKCLLGNIRNTITIDVGFGDTITPAPIHFQYPALLPDIPFPSLLAYNYETVVAEKIEAICKLGQITSRMKDFYDIIYIMETQKIDPAVLQAAIDVTFTHRGTDKRLFKILKDHAVWKEKDVMWRAFMQDSLPNEQLISFREALEKIRKYLSRYFV